MPDFPDEKRLSELEAKWLDGSITPDEAKEYADWYNQGQDDLVLIPDTFATSYEKHKQRIYNRIQPKDESQVVPMHRSRKIYWITSIAAASVIAAFLLMWNFRTEKNNVDISTQTKTVQNDVLPGKNKATLTLSNGQKIVLDDAQNGVLAQQGNTTISNTDGKLAYNGSSNTDAVLYNTLQTHRGEQYPITLSDGTRVWLNAESSLKFPVQFIEKERKVEITGEAYFEVAKDATHPFHVMVNGMDVRVLGTHFNINAYSDEMSINTTLLEGSVRVNNSLTLQPGQQSKLQKSGKLQIVNHIDTDAIIAWKNGNFTFDDADIATVMRQIEKWYDIDVVYSGEKTSDLFTGSIARSASLMQVLKILELSRVHFRLEGKKLTVLP